MCTTIRQRRPQSETDIYHVYSRGSGRQLIYESDDDRLMFLSFLSDATRATGTSLFAYALMGNHYHLVVKSDYEQLPKFGHALNRAYAKYFNEEHSRTGHLFQGRFSSEPIQDDSYFLAAIRYVHRNPVKPGIVSNCSYAWSSYDAYVEPGNQVTPPNFIPITTDLALDMLGGVNAFAEFHTHPEEKSFIDDTPLPTHLTDAEILAVARTILDGREPADLKALPKLERDAALARLRCTALSTAQISLITGISRSTILRAS